MGRGSERRGMRGSRFRPGRKATRVVNEVESRADAEALGILGPRAPSAPAVRGRKSVSTAPPEDRIFLGYKYPSVAERDRASTLEVLREGRHIKFWVKDPKFILDGAIYTADFLVVHWARCACGRPCQHVVVEEVKSHNYTKRPDWRRTRRNLVQVRTAYGVDVRLVEM